jgi:tetratricopeptide (TPR) repeat protein
LRLLTVTTFVAFLSLGLIFPNPCMASSAANNPDKSEQTNKRHRTISSTSVLGPPSLELNQVDNLSVEHDSTEPDNKRPRSTPPSPLETSFLGLDQWNSLPDEVWFHIFDQLSFPDLSTARQVCKYWGSLANDDLFSLPKQLLRHPLSILLWKLEDISDGPSRLKEEIAAYVLNQTTCQIFFASPDALNKSLLEPRAIGQVLRTSSLIPTLFESDITALEIYEALHQDILGPDQQTELEAYTKDVPIFPFEKGILSEQFIEYAKTYASYYKAFYLLSLFDLPTGEPMKDLLRRVEEEISSGDTYEDNSEDHAFFLPRAMSYLADISCDTAFNIGQYCFNWANKTSNEISKNLWLSFTEMFFHKPASQGAVDAQFSLSMLLGKQSKIDEAKAFIRQAASPGNIVAQSTLGMLLKEQGEFGWAEIFLRLATIQGNVDALYNLGLFLENQDKLNEAIIYYEKAIGQGHEFSCLSLAYLLETHPKLFEGSEADLSQLIAELRNQGRASFDAWSRARGL